MFMRRNHGILILNLLAVMLVLVSSCGRNGRIIPPGELSEIYAEMFLADKWITYNNLKSAADTSQVYPPIFKAHGYTTEDYLGSVDHYMSDPKELAEILEASQSILVEKLAASRSIQKAINKKDSLKQAAIDWIDESDFPIYAEIFKGNYSRTEIAVSKSDIEVYKVSTVPMDTVYKGPQLLLPVEENYDE